MVDRSVHEEHVESLVARVELLQGLVTELDRVDPELVANVLELRRDARVRAGRLRLERDDVRRACGGGVEAVAPPAGPDVEDARAVQVDPVEEVLEIEAEIAGPAHRPLGFGGGEVALA